MIMFIQDQKWLVLGLDFQLAKNNLNLSTLTTAMKETIVSTVVRLQDSMYFWFFSVMFIQDSY